MFLSATASIQLRHFCAGVQLALVSPPPSSIDKGQTGQLEMTCAVDVDQSLLFLSLRFQKVVTSEVNAMNILILSWSPVANPLATNESGDAYKNRAVRYMRIEDREGRKEYKFILGGLLYSDSGQYLCNVVTNKEELVTTKALVTIHGMFLHFAICIFHMIYPWA